MNSRRWSWRIALLSLAAAAVAVPLVQGPGVHRAEAATGWTMTWHDEFDGSAGSAPDGSKWKFDTGGSGFGNHELEYYTESRRNSALSGDGKLVMTARSDDASGNSCWYGTCRYTSARLLTAGKFTQKYGRFEASIKIPRGQGLWPAFWMLGDNLGPVQWPDAGEIDVMENIGREPATVHGSLHGPGYSGGNPITGAYQHPQGWSFADTFHQFAVEWSPTAVTWFVDNVPYQTKGVADAHGNQWVFDHPFFMVLNMAVGGDWPGSPDGSTSFPQTMTVDYVRVYAGSPAYGHTGRITGTGGKCADINNGSTADGTVIQLYTCLGAASMPAGSQKWSVGSDGTIRAKGKCMDVTGANPAAGTKIQLYTCNGSAAQQWIAGSTGQLRSVLANRCLDAEGGNSANYTRLQLWDCNPSGQVNQTWALP